MNFQTNTITVLSIANSVEEWRKILADDSAFKKELRAKLAELGAVQAARGNNISLGGDVQLDDKRIARATAKQNKHIEHKRFLVQGSGNSTTGAHVCPDCGATFKRNGNLINHLRDAHPKTLPAAAEEFVPAAD